MAHGNETPRQLVARLKAESRLAIERARQKVDQSRNAIQRRTNREALRKLLRAQRKARSG